MKGWPETRVLRRGIAMVTAALALTLLCAPALGEPLIGGSGPVTYPAPPRLGLPGAADPGRRHSALRRPRRPSRATVLTVQRLFRVLGYPLGRERRGRFGVRTKGALSYFQHKYHLPITGYPDARTVTLMRAVAASLTAAPVSAGVSSHDLIERELGGAPIMALGLAFALGLVLLALATRSRRKLETRYSLGRSCSSDD